jgi:hypothetical protein
MTTSKIIDDLIHDASAALVNFKQVGNILNENPPDNESAGELLQAAIEQLEELRQNLKILESDFNKQRKEVSCRSEKLL